MSKQKYTKTLRITLESKAERIHAIHVEKFSKLIALVVLSEKSQLTRQARIHQLHR